MAKWKGRRGKLAAISPIVAVIVVATTYVALKPAPACACSALAANIWVSTTGNDGTGTRSGSAIADPGTDFLTWNAAYAAAFPGDVIGIAAGTFGSTQDIEISAANGKPGTASVTFVAAGTVTINGSLTLGTYNSSNAPSYVTIQGLNKLTINQGTFLAAWKTGGQPTHDALLNTHIQNWSSANGDGTTGLQGSLLAVYNADHFTALGNEIGPGCCAGDGIGIKLLGSSTPNPSNIRLVRNNVHDLSDWCGEWPTRFGSCTVPNNQTYGFAGAGGCSVGNCDHVDAMEILGGAGLVVDGNKVFDQGDAKQGIYLVPFLGGTISNAVISNNTINSMTSTALYFSSDSGAGVPVYSGYIKILYNTVLGNAIIHDSEVAPGTTVTIAGNIFGFFSGNQSGGGCTQLYSDGSTLTPTWSKNLQAMTGPCSGDVGSLQTATLVQTLFPGAGVLCGTSPGNGGVATGSSACTTASGIPNLDLLGAQTAVDGGEAVYCGVGKTVTTDLHGTLRPLGAACDIGADEPS